MESARSEAADPVDEISAALLQAPAGTRLACYILSGGTPGFEVSEAPQREVWQETLRFARAQGILPLLHVRLAAQDFQPPPNVKDAASDSYHQHMLYNTRHYRAMLQVIEALQAHGLELIALKGVFLSLIIHGNPALRRSADLDILVRTEDLDSAAHGLARLGYKPSKPMSLDGSFESNHRRPHHLPGFHKAGSPWVEVHFNLAPPAGPFQIDIEGLWHRALRVQLDHVSTLALCPVDLLLHLCIHATYHHAFSFGLAQLYDITAVVRHYAKELDWNAVIDRAKAWSAAKCVYTSLLLARGLLNADVPADVLADLCPGDLDEDLRTWAVGQVLAERTPMGNAEQDDATGALIGSPWLRFKRTLRSAFPSPQTMAYIYPLDEHPLRLPFYYVHRGVQLLRRYGRRSWDIMLGRQRGTDDVAGKVAYHTFRNWLVE